MRRTRLSKFTLHLLIAALLCAAVILCIARFRAPAAPESAPSPTTAPHEPSSVPMPTPTPTPVPTPARTPEPSYAPKNWTLSFAGDCTIGTLHEWRGIGTQNNMLFRMGGDYAYPFANVKDIFEADDFTLVNFEGTLTESSAPICKDYRFSAPPEYAAVLTAGSVEAVSLANNHSVDYGAVGAADTRAALDGAGILWGDGETPIITELEDGLKLGIVPFNAVEIDLDVGDADGYMARIAPMYVACRESGCGIVIAFVHWGWEYRYSPEPWMVELAHALAGLGFNMVVGSHAHILQPMEVYEGVPIFYSLGNFCFGGHSNPKDKDCVIVRQEIVSPAEGEYALGNTELIPCRISTTDSVNDFRPTPYEPESAEYFRVLEKLGVGSA